MVLMNLSPLSAENVATFPQVMVSPEFPAVPNPILESQLVQLSSLFATRPILALEARGILQTALKPCLLQLSCKDARGPISVFHVLRPNEVERYFPSAINEYREVARLLMTMNLICWPIFIPRQTLEKGVFQ